MKTAVFFILARMESTAVLYFLRKGVKLHFYSLGTIFEENMWGIQRGIAVNANIKVSHLAGVRS